MRSLNTWGKYVDELLNERGVVCSQLYTACVDFVLFGFTRGGKTRLVRLLSDGFTNSFSHLKATLYSLLGSLFSTLSTAPITIRTN